MESRITPSGPSGLVPLGKGDRKAGTWQRAPTKTKNGQPRGVAPMKDDLTPGPFPMREWIRLRSPQGGRANAVRPYECERQGRAGYPHDFTQGKRSPLATKTNPHYRRKIETLRKGGFSLGVARDEETRPYKGEPIRLRSGQAHRFAPTKSSPFRQHQGKPRPFSHFALDLHPPTVGLGNGLVYIHKFLSRVRY